jgi:hypothetical protein
MSYRIEYDRGTEKYEIKENVGIILWMITGFSLLFVMLLSFHAEVFPWVKELLIPGDDNLTIQAFSAMTDDLRSGATIADAVETFCKTVIHGH